MEGEGNRPFPGVDLSLELAETADPANEVDTFVRAGIADPEADLFVARALFATITNANFDPDRFVELAAKAIELREALKAKLAGEKLPAEIPAATWTPTSWDQLDLVTKGFQVGLLADEQPAEREMVERMVARGYGAFREIDDFDGYVVHAKTLTSGATKTGEPHAPAAGTVRLRPWLADSALSPNTSLAFSALRVRTRTV